MRLIPGLGVPELLLIVVVLMMIFGAGKLPEMGSAIGKGIREFRRASAHDSAPEDGPPAAQVPPLLAVAEERCLKCFQILPASARFCSQCGSAVPTSPPPQPDPVSSSSGPSS